MIDHAVLASRHHPHDEELVVFFPDTGVLVLVIANYDLLLRSTPLSMTSGVQQIWRILGPERGKALPALHAFSGADSTGRFSRIGKATCLLVYLKVDGEVVKALQMLSDATEITDDLLSMLVHSSPLHTPQRVPPSCNGTCSVSIWLKVTSCLQAPMLSSSTSSESRCRSRPQYGVRQE